MTEKTIFTIVNDQNSGEAIVSDCSESEFLAEFTDSKYKTFAEFKKHESLYDFWAFDDIDEAIDTIKEYVDENDDVIKELESYKK